MGTLRKIGEGISQKTPNIDDVTCPLVFKKNGKYYTDVDYKTELTEEQVKDLTVIAFEEQTATLP